MGGIGARRSSYRSLSRVPAIFFLTQPRDAKLARARNGPRLQPEGCVGSERSAGVLVLCSLACGRMRRRPGRAAPRDFATDGGLGRPARSDSVTTSGIRRVQREANLDDGAGLAGKVSADAPGKRLLSGRCVLAGGETGSSFRRQWEHCRPIPAETLAGSDRPAYTGVGSGVKTEIPVKMPRKRKVSRLFSDYTRGDRECQARF
jgi:hypothetical protein